MEKPQSLYALKRTAHPANRHRAKRAALEACRRCGQTLFSGWVDDRSDSQGAKLANAHLARAIWRRSICAKRTSRTAIWRDQPAAANLQKADLRNANLRETILPGANLQGADMSGVHLRWRICRRVLREVNLEMPTCGAPISEALISPTPLAGRESLSDRIRRRYHSPDGTLWTPDTDMTRFTDHSG